MSASSPENVTTLIVAARHGDREAKDALFNLVYEELRAIAHRTPLVGRDGETMQPTVLANEAYLQFVRRIPPPPENEPDSRAAFFRTVALAMRTILRD
ncbi:MAG: ECF-type sigma factor, partial [Planctomycetota bacterium]|nr:ECF-type sigma factor [Planctomycetota bacterium]